MPHLATGTDVLLAIKVQVRARFGEQFGPGQCFLSDQILHLDCIAGQRDRAERQAANGADMVFELARLGPFDRPMATVVDPRRHFVEDRAVGAGKEFERQYLAGELELEFTPQGTLAEKLRAGGAGIPAFFTKTGVGTIVADGKELREFDGVKYVMERSIVPDVSLAKAYIADTSGNLIFRKTARNFNPNVAMAGRITVVEVEKIVDTGALDPDHVHLPGIYVHRIVLNATPEKRIEQRTIRQPENN